MEEGDVRTEHKPRNVLWGHSDGVTCLYLTGNRLYSGSYDHSIKCWDLENRSAIATYSGHSHTVWDVKLLTSVWAEGEEPRARLFSCGRDGIVREWDTKKSTQCLGQFNHHNSAVRGICCYKTHMLSASEDCTIKDWLPWQKTHANNKPPGDTKVRSLLGHSSHVVFCGVFDGWLYTGSADHTIKKWSLESRACALTYSGHVGCVNCIDYHPGEDHIFSASHDHTIKEWDVKSAECVHTYASHTFLVLCVVVTDEHMWSGGADGVIKEWELSSKHLKRQLTGHDGYVWALVVDVPNKRLFSAGNDKTIKEWDVLF